jgi:hypothetical protein
MQAVNAGEQIGGTLDERNKRAHGERDAALSEVAANAVEWRE